MYNPTPEQADIDRQKAYDTGVPHGYVPPGDKYAGHATVRLLVRSELHTDEEYGGPFWIEVSVSCAPQVNTSIFMSPPPSLLHPVVFLPATPVCSPRTADLERHTTPGTTSRSMPPGRRILNSSATS